MKKLILILITTVSYGQSPFLSVGQDIKMAVEGPYKDKVNDIGSTFNLEFKVGFDFDWSRIGLGAETHNEIHYNKYFIEYMRKLRPFRLKNVTMLAGVEGSLIRRNNKNISYDDEGHYMRNTSNVSYGVNAELMYEIPDTIVAVSLNYNVFKAEPEDAYGNDIDKSFRQDVMFNVYLLF